MVNPEDEGAPIQPRGFADDVRAWWHGINRVAVVYNTYTSLALIPVSLLLIAYLLGFRGMDLVGVALLGAYTSWAPISAVRYARQHGWPTTGEEEEERTEGSA